MSMEDEERFKKEIKGGCCVAPRYFRARQSRRLLHKLYSIHLEEQVFAEIADSFQLIATTRPKSA